MLYRKLIIIIPLLFFCWIQAEESSQHCLILERDFNFTPHTDSAIQNFTSSFLENLNQCSPATGDKLYYLQKLVTTLNNSGASNKTEMMVFASQNILNNIEMPSLENAYQVLSEFQASSLSEMQNQLQTNDLFFIPAHTVGNPSTQVRMIKRSVQILERDFEVTSVVSFLTADFVLCQNTESVVFILIPLINWITQEITRMLLANEFSHPHLFYSSLLSGVNTHSSTVGLNFPYQFSSEQLAFFIQQLPSSAYAQSLKQRFLQPIYELMSIRDMYDQKLREHCTDEVQEWKNVKFLEDHYRLVSDSPPENRMQFFRKLSRQLALPNALILNFTAGPNYQNFYRFSIQQD